MWGDDDGEDIDMNQQNSNNMPGDERQNMQQQDQMSEELKIVIEYFLISSEKIKRSVRMILQDPKPVEETHDYLFNVMEFFNIRPDFQQIFFREPKNFISLVQQAIIHAQQGILEEIEEQKNQGEQEIQDKNNVFKQFNQEPQIKENIQIKFFNIPYTANIYKQNLGDLDTYDLDKIVVLNGTVIRQTGQKTLEKQKVFKCVQCGEEYTIQNYNENYNQFEQPPKCTNTVSKPKKENPFTMRFNNNKGKGGGMKGQKKFVDQACGSKKFDFVDNTAVMVDYQEVLIQEPFKTIKSGNIPKTIWIILEGTLVNTVKAGDDITVTGILIKRNKKLVKDSRPDLVMAIIANNINVKQEASQFTKEENLENDVKQHQMFEEIEFFWHNQRNLYSEIEARNMIIKSVCSYIYMKYDIKLALLLCLIGGVSGVQQNTRIRGQCHLLLVGEPGVGKSQFLKYANKLSQRSVFTNGIGTSSAGLTVSHTRDNGEWMLEAGALVLADKGVCCIDEFNLIKKSDFPSVLEAMEQQTISGLKAGTMSKLNTRTTVIAACNPVTAGQKYNNQYDLSENVGIGTALISRFDLIFVIVDECNAAADMETCDFILGRFMKKSDKEQMRMNNTVDYEEDDQTDKDNKKEQLWDIDKLREYISYIQQRFEPIVNKAAQNVLMKYYQHLRTSEEIQSKITIRTLESLVRLSQAHARLMFRDEVQEFDAICIVILNECAFNTNLFPDVPLQEYMILNYEKYMEIDNLVLSRLGLN